MGCACTIACVTKVVTTYAQVSLTETRGSAYFRISWNVLRVCVFRYANETGTKSVIHFPVLPLYNVLTAKRMSMILTRDLWRKIICSPRLMNTSTLFSTICRNCGATIYGYKVLIKPYRRIILFSQHRRRKRMTWDFGV